MNWVGLVKANIGIEKFKSLDNGEKKEFSFDLDLVCDFIMFLSIGGLLGYVLSEPLQVLFTVFE